VVDDSSGMLEEQQKYLPLLVRQLEELPGGLPSLHVGVVSTDLGVGPHSIEQCTAFGAAGALQNAPRVPGCVPPEGAFIADELDGAGERVRNYQGTLAETFMCIAAVGDRGCGFEQPLEAMRRALDGSISKNIGFLRDDAFLAVVFLTDEDDCSASDPAMLFDPAPALDSPSSPLGPFASFRCTRFGLTCDGGPPSSAGAKTGCAPREGSLVAHTDAYVAFLTAIKDPSATMITVVAGAPSPVIVVPTGSGGLRLSNACLSDLGIADPAVRLARFAGSFPNHAVSSICDGDDAQAVFSLGDDVRRLIIAYTEDQRGDLDLSYGCAAAGRAPAPAGALALLALLLVYHRRVHARLAARRPE
jgi:hypothetical protein